MQVRDILENLVLNQRQEWLSQKDRFRLCQSHEKADCPTLHTE